MAAVVWQGTGATRHSVLAQPLRHLLHLHLGVAPHAVRCSLDAVDAPLRAGGHSIASSASAAANDAFTMLAAAIRSLDGLPLAVTAVLPVGATFSHTEAFPPLPAAAGAPPAAGSPVLRFCVELEGSGKWPDDEEAVAALKTAFCLRMCALLEEQASLHCEPRREGAAVQVDGLVFVGAIAHAPHAALLRAAGRDDAADLLDTHTTAGAAHTGAMQSLGARHAAFAPAVRLVKRWLSSHLLSGVVSPQLIELVAAAAVASPAEPPAASAIRGFLRILSLLASHRFDAEPLIVGVSAPLTADVRAAAAQAFEAARAAPDGDGDGGGGGGALVWVATEAEPQGTRWAAGAALSPPLLKRLQTLAAASVARLREVALPPPPPAADADAPARPPPSSASAAAPTAAEAAVAAADAEVSAAALAIFAPPLHEFDALIELAPSEVPRRELQLRAGGAAAAPAKPRYANLDLGRVGRGVGDAPVRDLVASLREAYGSLALFCYDGDGGGAIGVKWKPHAFVPSAFRAAAAEHRLVVAREAAAAEGGRAPSAWLVPDVAAVLEGMAAVGGTLVKRVRLQTGGAAAFGA